MTGNLVCLLMFVLVLRSLILIPFTNNNIKTEDNTTTTTTQVVEKKEEIILDTTVYDNLPINNLYVDLGSDSLTDNINWANKNGTYILYLPQGYNRDNLRVTFYDKPNTQVTVYNKDGNELGKIINNKETNLLKDDEVIIKTNVNSKNVHTYKLKIMQSGLPSVSINLPKGDQDLQRVHASANHTVETTGDILIIDKDNNKIYSKLESFKGRGNRTWERYKKPYQIKFKDKLNLFNMGNAKAYNLITNTFDGTLARNYIFFDLSKKLGLEYSVDAEPVDLYVNNNYMGSYLLTEKVQAKKNRVEIKDNDYLFEIENHPSGNDYIYTSRGTCLTLKNPELDEVSASERNKIKNEFRNYINKIENLMYGNNSDEELMKSIDYESFAKYYWVQEMSLNYDAMRGSNYFYTKDGKLYAGPGWDFDHTLNRSYEYASTSSYYVLGNNSLTYRIRNNWYKWLAKRQGFSDEIDKVYLNYRSTFNDLVNVSNNYSNYIRTSADMNWTKFNYLNDARAITYMPINYSNTSYDKGVEYLNRELQGRINFYNNQYKNVIYDSFKIKYNGVEQILDKDNTNYIPSDVSDIIIYGIKDGQEKEVKKYSIGDKNEISFELSSKTGLTNKRVNRIIYTFKIERKN